MLFHSTKERIAHIHMDGRASRIPEPELWKRCHSPQGRRPRERPKGRVCVAHSDADCVVGPTPALQATFKSQPRQISRAHSGSKVFSGTPPPSRGAPEAGLRGYDHASPRPHADEDERSSEEDERVGTFQERSGVRIPASNWVRATVESSSTSLFMFMLILRRSASWRSRSCFSSRRRIVRVAIQAQHFVLCPLEAHQREFRRIEDRGRAPAQEGRPQKGRIRSLGRDGERIRSLQLSMNTAHARDLAIPSCGSGRYFG
jgi:hypothetical protein